MTKTLVIGVDEVGRGPLAGPVVVGAVCFVEDSKPIEGITDSKKLSEKKRSQLSPLIWKTGVCAVAEGSVERINLQGIQYALVDAMESAVGGVLAQLSTDHLSSIEIKVDGIPPKNPPLLLPHPTQFIPKGDSLVYEIGAASIIAKVFRDALMSQLSLRHPEYDWDNNAGYGMKKHRLALEEHGLTIHHRQLFCRNLKISRTQLARIERAA